MRNSFYKFFLVMCGCLTCPGTFAQTPEAIETGMRSNGKIYVVMAICVTILAGLFLYLVSIDRKIGKIEDRQ